MEGHGGRCVGIQKEELFTHDIIDAIEKHASSSSAWNPNLYKVAEELF